MATIYGVNFGAPDIPETIRKRFKAVRRVPIYVERSDRLRDGAATLYGIYVG